MFHFNTRGSPRLAQAASRAPKALRTLLAASLLATSPAWAGIAATTGDVQNVTATPPTDVREGKYEDNKKIRAFEEQRGVVLGAPLAVDLTAPGLYDATHPMTPGFIAPGTLVNSYLLHFDHVGILGSSIRKGTLTLDEPILGILVAGTTLDSSDGLKRAGVTYPVAGAEPSRGLELTDPDSLTWLGGNDVSVDLTNRNHSDQVRIITAASAPGITFSIDRQSFHGSLVPLAPAFSTFGAPTGIGGGVGEGDLLTVGSAAPGPNAPVLFPPAPGMWISSANIGLGALNVREIDALSYGRDQLNGRCYFSVDEWARGRNGAAFAPLVNEAATMAKEASADVFRATDAACLVGPVVAGNAAWSDGNGTGTVPGVGLLEPNGDYATVPDEGDNLDALDIDTVPSDAQGFIYFSLDGAFDDPREAGAFMPNYGSASAYEIACFGGMIGGGADIFVAHGTAVPPCGAALYATYANLGLKQPGPEGKEDDVDALALWDDGDGIYEPGVDRIYFSLRVGSQTLGAADCAAGGVLPIEPGDILTPNAGGGAPCIAVRADTALGLRTKRLGAGIADDLDGLDIVRDSTLNAGNPN
jgi:hypothetical protein